MANPESNAEIFAHILEILPKSMREDVYEFIRDLSFSSSVDDDMDIPPEVTKRMREKLMNDIKSEIPVPPELPPPNPQEQHELTLILFNQLRTEEQRLGIFYLLMKLQDVYRPILGDLRLNENALSESSQNKLRKIITAVELTYPMIESRVMPARNVLPDLSTLPEQDQNAVIRAEKRLAWAVAYNYTATNGDEYVALMQESARRELSKIYAYTAKLPAADILSKSVQQGFIATYQRAGLAQHYLS